MTINRIALLMACVVGIGTATTGVLAQDSTGPAAVFIDHFAGGFGGGGFRAGGLGGGEIHGGYARIGDVSVAHVGGAYWHAPVYHGAWYRGAPVAAGVAVGAAVGAAAANPYYYPSQCGYYPLPPCY